MNEERTLTIDGRCVTIEDDRNLLELARRTGIDIPTFCYHSELSIYGACRLCVVEIQGRGVVASCSVLPEPGMVVRTHTEQIRQMRRIALELILADHDQNCTTCSRSTTCQLQALARRFGVHEVRFQRTREPMPVDRSSPSLVRDPNKCVLCGDCVRACQEIQEVGAIDFAGRGAEARVGPAFGWNLADVECVHCGLCARVCPTGALAPRDEADEVWNELEAPRKRVVVQIAPAVRVAIGEAFGFAPGTAETGRLVAALKMLGFDAVFDTSFAADMTVLEEATEFLERKKSGQSLPQFTSCCPGWVKFAEQFFPDLLPHLSSCKSPQQMFGTLAKAILPARMEVPREDLVVVSIMPCTAKKFEAKLNKFTEDATPDVDHVLTTQELARMIEEAGIDFATLEPASFDMPLGFKTGAGVIFGTSGGVSEAVLRYAVEVLDGFTLDQVEFEEVRGEAGLREATVTAGETTVRLAVVHGLANAKRVAKDVRDGRRQYDLIEVMACPGGCVHGAGQPRSADRNAAARRSDGLYQIDRTLQLHRAQENHLLANCYEEHLGGIGSETAHHLLHTTYQSRRRIISESIPVLQGQDADPLTVSVCVGTGCFVRGAQELLQEIVGDVKARGLDRQIQVEATFCTEHCDRGPVVVIGGELMTKCTLEEVRTAIDARLPAARA